MRLLLVVLPLSIHPQCMHSQAVDFTSMKLVLEPATKLLFGASMATSDASECVSVHSLDIEVRSQALQAPTARPTAVRLCYSFMPLCMTSGLH